MKNVYKVPENFSLENSISIDEYNRLYNESIKDPTTFWQKQAKRINWIKDFSHVKDVSFDKEDLHIKWFYDGTLNVSANCIDRHLKTNGNKVAILWQGDSPEEEKSEPFS